MAEESENIDFMMKRIQFLEKDKVKGLL